VKVLNIFFSPFKTRRREGLGRKTAQSPTPVKLVTPAGSEVLHSASRIHDVCLNVDIQ
jgi:hypothetical protein